MVKGVKEKSSDLKHFLPLVMDRGKSRQLPLTMREENKGANCMTPEEKKELQRQKRAKKNQEKMALERERKREKQLKNADREKEKAKREYEAMNNMLRTVLRLRRLGEV
ncbi:hypothetical protein CKQ69_29780 [Bacillus toyonensis]|nr:hypothetical protein CKQ69_29780 [Bacillus toyonensis]